MENAAFSNIERRKFPRFRVRLAVVYQIDKPVSIRMQIGEKEILATTLDLSEGGIAISTNYNIPLGSSLMIKFTLFKVDSDDKMKLYGPMEIIGEVRSNTMVDKMCRLGICFTQIEERDKVEINNFLKMTSEQNN